MMIINSSSSMLKFAVELVDDTYHGTDKGPVRTLQARASTETTRHAQLFISQTTAHESWTGIFWSQHDLTGPF